MHVAADLPAARRSTRSRELNRVAEPADVYGRWRTTMESASRARRDGIYNISDVDYRRHDVFGAGTGACQSSISTP